MATTLKGLDLTVGELVEVDGRRYEVVPDGEGGITIEPPVTLEAELHVRRGTMSASAVNFERLSVASPSTTRANGARSTPDGLPSKLDGD